MTIFKALFILLLKYWVSVPLSTLYWCPVLPEWIHTSFIINILKLNIKNKFPSTEKNKNSKNNTNKHNKDTNNNYSWILSCISST